MYYSYSKTNPLNIEQLRNTAKKKTDNGEIARRKLENIRKGWF